MQKTLTQKSWQEKMRQQEKEISAIGHKTRQKALKQAEDLMNSKLSELALTLDTIQETLTAAKRQTRRQRWMPVVVTSLVCASICATLWLMMQWHQQESYRRGQWDTIRTIGEVRTVNGQQWLMVRLPANPNKQQRR